MSASALSPATQHRGAYEAELQRRREALTRQLEPILAPLSTFVWELGCGHGHFLTEYAKAHQDELCVGIDIVSERIRRAQRKRDRAGLDNLVFAHAESRMFLETLPVHISFTELFILFPDPWPKSRHHKHRIIGPEFLTQAAVHAAENARLCFRTDSPAYFDQARRVLGSHPHWRIVDEAWPFEYYTVFQSRADRFDSVIARLAPDVHAHKHQNQARRCG